MAGGSTRTGPGKESLDLAARRWVSRLSFEGRGSTVRFGNSPEGILDSPNWQRTQKIAGNPPSPKSDTAI